MILIYGRMDDPPLSTTVEALQEIGRRVRPGGAGRTRSRGARHSDRAGWSRGPSDRGRARTVRLESLHSVYARPLEIPSHQWDPGARAHAQRLHEQLFEWLDVAPALVVNRPRTMQANGSKPLQIQLIGEAGFLVPETLVTSCESEAREFWQRHGRVVYKSVSGVRSIVQELDEHAATRLGQLRLLPVQFQQFVPGVDVRVHVVGNRAFAAEIVGVGIDYRYSARHGGEARLTATELPPDLEERCVVLSRRMGLPLSGIDLRRRPDGTYVCFEVNPMPAYSYFEAHTGLPISRALAELLVEGFAEPIEVTDAAGRREFDATRRDDCRSPAASAAR